MIPFSPAPAAHELPAQFPSPFDRTAIHPLAQRAAADTIDLLQSPASAAWQLGASGGGKMFGVLVVRARSGEIGYLRAFSGTLAGTWDVDGWAAPTFERAPYDALLRSSERELAWTTMAHDTRAFSQALLPRLQDTYRFASARGNVAGLRALFAPAEPPGGAGDCAAPKLLAEAYRRDLTPIALAEFWWGAPPRTGDRRAGAFYPACRGKCAPILAHMLDGLPLAPAPVFGADHIDPAAPLTVFEDEWLVVVEKPVGLLSVPGRNPLLQDSVLTRLRARYPHATGPLLVHRLDLDTSGLLLAAKSLDTFVALQRQFAERVVTKSYVAWVDGVVARARGTIDLPLRVDVDDRPRQVHDPVHGKAARTDWAVLERSDGRTRLVLTPHTGRTHQLRVHAAHPLGLDAPIVGDRLYGRVAPEHGDRLLLHAARLDFAHPVTGALMTVERPAPF